METWLKIFLVGIALVAVCLATMFIACCVEMMILKIIGAAGVIMGICMIPVSVIAIDDDKED